MASEHQHFWQIETIIQPPAYEARACYCGYREQRLRDGFWGAVEKSAEEQLQEAQEEIERWRVRDAEWAESQAYAVTRYAQARVWLERFAGMLDETFRADGSLLGAGFNISFSDLVDFCREVRTWMAEPQEQQP